MRSCSQNIGPDLATNRLKFTVVMDMERASRVESRRGAPLLDPYMRGADGALAGSCNAEESRIDVKFDPLPFDGDIGVALAGDARTGECSGRGREVRTLGAGRRSSLGCSERKRVA